MALEACCTCASLLSAVPRVSATSEKPLPDQRQLHCCGRIICGACISANPRFLSYCPYCQTPGRAPLEARAASKQAEQAEKKERDTETNDSNPPPYSAVAASLNPVSPSSSRLPSPSSPPALSPPPYTPTSSPSPSPPSEEEKNKQGQFKNATTKTNTPPTQTQTPPGYYAVHHLRHPPHPHPDTLASLSLRYGIPQDVLRAHNSIPAGADYLLAARHTLLIPTAYLTSTTTTTTTTTATCSTTTDSALDTNQPQPQPQPRFQPQLLSLSPHPVEDAAERARKTTLRRFMVACKEADYDTALVYLQESEYDLDKAVGRYVEDAEWELAHPYPRAHSRLRGRRAGKGKSEGSGEGGSTKGAGKGDKALSVGGGTRRLGWWKGLVG